MKFRSSDPLFSFDLVLEDEVKRGMMMLGATKVSELKPEHVELMDGLLGKQFKSS